MSSCPVPIGSRYANLLSPQLIYVKPNEATTCPSKDATKLCAQLGSSTHPATMDEAYALAFTPEYVNGNVLLLGGAGTFGSVGSNYVLGGRLSYQFSGSPLAHVLGNFVPPSSSPLTSSQSFLKGVTVLGGTVSLSNAVISSTKVVLTDVQILNSNASDMWTGLSGTADAKQGLLSIKVEQSTVDANIGKACVFSNPSTSTLSLSFLEVSITGIYQGQNLCEVIQNGQGTTRITSNILDITFPDGPPPLPVEAGALLLITATGGSIYRVLSQTDYQTGSATVVKTFFAGDVKFISSIQQSFRTTQNGTVDDDTYSGNATVERQVDTVTRQQLAPTNVPLHKVSGTDQIRIRLNTMNSTDTSQVSDGNAHQIELSGTADVSKTETQNMKKNSGVNAVLDSLTTAGKSYYNRKLNNVSMWAVLPVDFEKASITEYDESLASTILKHNFSDESKSNLMYDAVYYFVDKGVVLDAFATDSSTVNAISRSSNSTQILPIPTPRPLFQVVVEKDATVQTQSTLSVAQLNCSAAEGVRYFKTSGNAKLSSTHTDPNWVTTGSTTNRSESADQSTMMMRMEKANIETKDFLGHAIAIKAMDSSTLNQTVSNTNVSGESLYASAEAIDAAALKVAISGPAYTAVPLPLAKADAIGKVLVIFDFRIRGALATRVNSKAAEAINSSFAVTDGNVTIPDVPGDEIVGIGYSQEGEEAQGTLEVSKSSFTPPNPSAAAITSEGAGASAKAKAVAMNINATDGRTSITKTGNTIYLPKEGSCGWCLNFSGTNEHSRNTEGNKVYVNGTCAALDMGDDSKGMQIRTNNDFQTLAPSTVPAISRTLRGNANFQQLLVANNFKSFVSDEAAIKVTVEDNAQYSYLGSNQTATNAGDNGKTFGTVASGSSSTSFSGSSNVTLALAGATGIPSTAFEKRILDAASITHNSGNDTVLSDIGSGFNVSTEGSGSYTENPTGPQYAQLAPSGESFVKFSAKELSTITTTPSSTVESYQSLLATKDYAVTEGAKIVLNSTATNVVVAGEGTESVYLNLMAKDSGGLTALSTGTNISSVGNHKSVNTSGAATATVGSTASNIILGGIDQIIQASGDSTTNVLTTNSVAAVAQAVKIGATDNASVRNQSALTTVLGTNPSKTLVDVSSTSNGTVTFAANTATFSSFVPGNAVVEGVEKREMAPIMGFAGAPSSRIDTDLNSVTLNSAGMGIQATDCNHNHTNVLAQCLDKAYDLTRCDTFMFSGQFKSGGEAVIHCKEGGILNVGASSIAGEIGILGDGDPNLSTNVTSTNLNTPAAAILGCRNVTTAPSLSFEAGSSDKAVGADNLTQNPVALVQAAP